MPAPTLRQGARRGRAIPLRWLLFKRLRRVQHDLRGSPVVGNAHGQVRPQGEWDGPQPALALLAPLSALAGPLRQRFLFVHRARAARTSTVTGARPPR